MPRFSKKTKIGRLYYGLAKNKFRSEEGAVEWVGGPAYNTSAFKKLKLRLKNALLEAIFLNTFKEVNYLNYHYSHMSVYMQLSTIKTLISNSARINAINLAEKTIKYSQRFEFTEVTFILARDLAYHYSTLDPQKKKYQKYDRIQEESLKILQAESLAYQTYNFTIFNLESDSKSFSSKNLLLKINTKIVLLIEKFPDISSTRFLLCKQTAIVNYRQQINDFQKVIEACDFALSEFEKKSFPSELMMNTFYRKKALALFNLGEVQEALKILRKSLKLIRPTSHNWGILIYYEILFTLHLQKFQQAYNIWENNLRGKEIATSHPHLIELHLLEHAYLEFLRSIGKVSGSGEKFRVAKFLNEVPEFQKEKQRWNIAIILVQLLFMLARNEHPRYLDRIDALQQYRRRYLRENFTYRANCIIHMMVMVGKYGFHPKRVKIYAAKEYQKLKNRPPEISGSSAEIEIIRYEHLWEIVVELLERNYKLNH